MIDYRELPPVELRPVPEAKPSPGATQFYTDVNRPPHPPSAHYWDPQAGCWFPRPSFRHPFVQFPASVELPNMHVRQAAANLRNEYIRQNYTPEEIRENYSAIREELTYPKIPVTLDPRIPPGKVIVTSVPDKQQSGMMQHKWYDDGDDLTLLSASAILNVTPQPDDTEENRMDVVLSRSEAEAAYKRAAAALAKIDELERKYSPDLPDGSIVAFRLTFPSSPATFNYAAIRAAGQWFATGKVSSNHTAGIGVDWSALLECFERYAATDFEVLRTGGEEKELPPSSTTADISNRVVRVDIGSDMSAFQGAPSDLAEEDDDDNDD